MKIFVGVCFDSLQVLGLRFGNPRPKLEKPYKKCRVLIECAEADTHENSIKQLFLGLWLDFCFTNFLDFNCDGYYDGELYRRARGALPFVFTLIETWMKIPSRW
jgi:hypothetical protein